jgi:hypothetical protein
MTRKREPGPWEALGGQSNPLIKAAPRLLVTVEGAMHALRSYQYGNSSTELAESMADACEGALREAKGGNL